VHGAAAGGITAGLYGVLNAQLVAGSKFILDQIGFDEALTDSSLVITGEGKLDDQTLDGKAPYEVARRAQERGIPVLAFGGEVPDHPLPPFTAVQSITNKPMPLQAAIDNVETLLEAAARNAAIISRLRPNL
jgi:glycerate kinase